MVERRGRRFLEQVGESLRPLRLSAAALFDVLVVVAGQQNDFRRARNGREQLNRIHRQCRSVGQAAVGCDPGTQLTRGDGMAAARQKGQQVVTGRKGDLPIGALAMHPHGGIQRDQR